MQGKTQIVQYKKSFINIYFFGEGNKWLFCFHGYGEEGSSFEVLKNSLSKEYTLAAIDLPFHGKTKWNEGLLIAPEDLINIINIILHNNNSETKKKISLIGFSLGGRVALHLLQTIPAQLERTVLIAPDGLHINFWYWLGTQTSLGNKLFAWTMKNPNWFFPVISFGYKIGLLNKSIVKIVHYYLDDEEQRLLLYQRWTTMRKFKPKASSIMKAIDKYKIPVRFLFGKYDRIILSKRSAFFQNNKHVKITVIEAGHQLLGEKYVDDIASLFSQ